MNTPIVEGASNSSTRLSRILACISLGAWLFLLWPYPVTTFMAGSVSCLFYPLYLRLRQRFTMTGALLIYMLGLSLLVLVPIVVVVWLVTPQAVAGLQILDQLRDSGWALGADAQARLASIDIWLKDIPGLEDGLHQLASQAASLAGAAARTVLLGGVGLAGGAFQAVLVLLLFVMISSMCVVQGGVIRDFVQRISGFPEGVVTRLTLAVRRGIFGVAVGVVLVAVIQGVLCGLAFAVAEVPQAAFWGLLATFVAPIPFVGTALVWGPTVVWLWFSGAQTSAVGVFLWCVMAVTGVDNVLRPMFLKTGIKASLIPLILSILCGLAAFGPVGIFAGPVFLALALQAAIESSVCQMPLPPQKDD